MKRWGIGVIAVVVALAVAACGETVGKNCRERVERGMTDQFLREEWGVRADALTKATQAATTCREVPVDFPLDDALDHAGSEIQRKLREGSLP